MNEVSAMMGIAQLSRIESLVEQRIAVAEIFSRVLKQFKSFKLQTATYPAKHTYYTLGAIYDGNTPWKSIYDAYSEEGAEPFYAAVSNPYLEATLINQKPGSQIFQKGLCPNAEFIQEKLMAFKTNYITLEAANDDARKLEVVLRRLGVS